MTLPLERYMELVDRVRARIRLHVPPGSIVLVAIKGGEALAQLEGYRAWHFPQNEFGVYAGHYPANSAAAVAHLRHLQRCGAQYLVLPWTARWWLDYYADFATHLNTAHAPLVSDEGLCLIFELHAAAASEADGEALDADGHADDADPRVDEIGSASATPAPIKLAAPTAAAPTRILTILARFGTDRYPEAERDIDEIFRRLMREADRTIVTVDNALPHDFVQRRSNRTLLGGDNSAREFSAFDRAL